MFKTSGKGTGIQLTFSNGYTVSVQWHHRAYSDNRHGPDKTEAVNAEVAVWDANGRWVKLDKYDDVRGWQDADSVARLIARVQAIDPSNPPNSLLEW